MLNTSAGLAGHAGRCLALAGAVLLFGATSAAWAQCVTDTSTTPNTINCTLATPTSPATISGNAPGLPGAIDADTVNVTVTPLNPQSLDGPVLTITANGVNGAASGDPGGQGGAITVNNSSALYFSGSPLPGYGLGTLDVASAGGSGISAAGGAGGAINITDSGDIDTQFTGSGGHYGLAGILASSSGGTGYGNPAASGNGGAVTVTLAGAPQIITSGIYAPGIQATSTGFAGGAVTVDLAAGTTASITTIDGNSPGISAGSLGEQTDNGEQWGPGGNVTVNSGAAGASLTVDAQLSQGIYAYSTGGYGGIGQAAPSGGNVSITQNGAVTAAQAGILAVSSGGPGATTGGNGGTASVSYLGGTVTAYNQAGIEALSQGGLGGSQISTGGAGGTASVTTAAGSTVNAINFLTPGVVAASLGAGGTNYNGNAIFTEVFPGAAGNASVTNGANVTIAAAGDAGAPGVLAASIAGGGGLVYWNGSADFNFGDVSAAGAAAGTASITDTGTVTTAGDDSPALMAQSIGGGGGVLGLDGSSSTIGIGGAPTDDSTIDRGGNGATVSDTGGNLITSGQGAFGVLAQSIGGGGGTTAIINAGGVLSSLGAAGTAGGDGGAVTVNLTDAQVETAGDNALGVLAQSIGGGGGNGRNSSGVFQSVGGTAGAGGAGGDITVALSGGGIVTGGDFAAGVLAQGIGGGGGNGGAAKSTGLFASAAIGGTGGAGGAGGTVNFSNMGDLSTTGEASDGAILQSIGGGGGNGGAANDHTIGVIFSAAMALGGTGGSGGSGAAITAGNNGTISTSGIDSVGLLAQSIGGGGGNGGSALAKSLTLFDNDPELPEISFSSALGGHGGVAGDGGALQIANQTGNISTLGDGAFGILAQSIGGGGGNGADSSAAASAELAKAPSLKFAVSLGGDAAGGGAGGGVNVSNIALAGDCNGCAPPAAALISTAGNNAAGMFAQSIGGGGGNGGAGNAATASQNLGNVTGLALGFTYGLGGSGGGGGAGGAVTAANETLFAESYYGVGSTAVITTTGSGSQGILAQSIGGGGGNAGGAAAAGSGDVVNTNIAMGGSGGGGGAGGAVTATNDGVINTGGSISVMLGSRTVNITTGGDSVGLFAQSIGGGGGTGGSSDAAATFPAMAQIENLINPPPGGGYSGNLALGGSAGGGGAGGLVTASNGGSITTLGERAYGLLAQSVGGGGGEGGLADSAAGPTSVIDPNAPTYAATLALGAKGGDGGDGGAVNASSPGSILTQGYGASALIAQSIGGGGGIGNEGTVNNQTTIGLGANINGAGGVAGGGGAVTAQARDLTTLGDDAFGLLAQSVGGGGGLASAGCTNSAARGIGTASATACFGNVGASGAVNAFTDASDFSLAAGGGSGANGSGGAVSATTIGSAGDAIITTAGARAIAILAQSIGGGGGVATAASANIGGTKLQKNAGDNSGAGGDVTVTTQTFTNITTYGNGAWGILAQSIGGGGGLLGDTSGTLGNLVSNTLPNIDKDEHADGGTVDISLTNTELQTYGANAHGIFAQSIGGGGGIVGDSTGVQAGNSAQIYGLSGMNYSGQGGAVTVNLTGSTVYTAGAGSIGIVAQSSGNENYQSQIQVSLTGGNVIGGSGAGAAGIELSGGDAENNGHGNVPNTITLDANSTLTTQNGTSGTAITTNDGLTNVSNAGSITGSILLGATPGTVTNSGTILTGATIQASSVTNTGTLNIDAPVAALPTPYPGRTTTFTGDLVLASANGTPGKIILGADMANKTNDKFVVEGDLTGQNRLQVNPVTLLPGTSLTIYQVDGNDSGSLLPIDPLAYDYAINPAGGGAYALSAAAHFTLPRGTTLTSSEIGGAALLQSVWDAGLQTANNGWSQNFKQQIGTLFADAATATPAAYKSAMDVLVPHIDNASANETLGTLQDIAAAAQNCPAFEGPDARLAEGDCVWQRTAGNFINQNDTAAGMGYGGSAVTLMLGGQKQIRPGWFVGGVAAYGESWFQSSDKLESRNQQTGAGALSLKHEMGPWLFSVTAAGGGGSGAVSRVIDLPDFLQTATGNSGLGFGLARLRMAYQFVAGKTYITPELDLDTAYIWQGGYTESGAGILDLNVAGAGKAIFAATPLVEAGERIDLHNGMQLQPHITVGLTGLADGSWVTPVKLAAAPGTGYTNVKTPLPNLLGQINLGIDLYDPNGWQAKLQYGTSIGGSYNTQSVTLRLIDRF